ncbi:hypothetical protein LTR74_018256 [Friedmanniomyces endolithicus]|nr:hypothetical protein LTR74_018256 [Friedmanniomyces endolithicus]
MQIPFPRVQASFLDGRAQSTRHKQAQFHRLFEAATGSAHAIKLALQADSGNSLAEVDLEFSLALSSLKQHYSSLDLKKQLQSDRQIEIGEGNAGRRRPLGIVYIIPSKWAPFYSIVSAWAAATAAGCPVLCETSFALRQLFQQSLDPELFAVSDSRPPADFAQQCTLVNQNMEDVHVTSWARVLEAPAQSTSVAVVNRSADIGATAITIATAGFAFGGKSSYSPHSVLVNEFRGRFIHGRACFTSSKTTNRSKRVVPDIKRTNYNRECRNRVGEEPRKIAT